MRAKNVQDEFGSASSNLASASVQTATREREGDSKPRKGMRPNDACHLKGHIGHLNKDCSWQKLRKLKDNGRAAPPMFDSDGKKICEFLTNRIYCPFQVGKKKCNQSHRLRGTTNRRVNNVTTDSSDDERERRKRAKRNKKKKSHKHGGKHKHKKKHRSVHVARTTSEDSSTTSCSDSSDFP